MDGIAVLDTIEIYTTAWWQIILCLLPTIIAGVVFQIRFKMAFKKGSAEEQANNVVSVEHWSPKELLIVLAGGLVSMFLAACMPNLWPTHYVETRYEIKVEDSVSFNDVYNKYVILEEKENTIIVKERNQ